MPEGLRPETTAEPPTGAVAKSASKRSTAKKALEEFTRFSGRRRFRAYALVAVAVVIAVVTGLSTQYAGKAFGGSRWDYINIFLWGFTTKIVLDLAVAALDGLRLLRLAR